MSINWYYVEGNERVGPVTEEELKSLFDSGQLVPESYVWTKGQSDWSKLNTIASLQYFLNSDSSTKSADEAETGTEVEDIPIIEMEPLRVGAFDWNNVDQGQRTFSIKTGIDREGPEAEYGPFSLDQIILAFKENRINGKSLIFTPGMEDWTFLADIPLYEQLFEESPPQINDEERRKNTRKPFVARMLFHDNQQIFEGVCRDISIGGMQVLVAGQNFEIGEEVNLNVHPENSDVVFVACGSVVRVLDGGQGFSIRFKKLGKQAYQSIDNYINQGH